MHPPKEQTYTITSTMQIAQPVDPAVMNDDFQDVRVISRDANSVTVEITYYPLNEQTIGEDFDWKQHSAAMQAYLRPNPSENWDQAMQQELLTELSAAGIDPDNLSDKQLVELVSRWAMSRAKSVDTFAIWAVYFDGGKPAVFPSLRDAFNHEKPDASWTDQQLFDQEALGKSMFFNKVHGSCTSYSIYQATILRALGIPTRIVFCIPPFDANDPKQAEMFFAAIHDNQVRETIRGALEGMSGFDNHLFNEVFVGGHWVRLNYERLGQPILDKNYFGLLTHIFTTSDMSATPMAKTWGMRYFDYNESEPKLSSENPYRLISVSDHFGSQSHIDNPDVPIAEFRTVTIDGVYLADSKALPDFFHSPQVTKTGKDIFISYKERLSAAHPMRTFFKQAGHEFLLKAPGHDSVRVHWSGGASISAHGTETIAAQIDPQDKPKLAPGVQYGIEPTNISDTYKWVVAPDVKLEIPKS
jgi:transglutaminase-like putative cysteine protease